MQDHNFRISSKSTTYHLPLTTYQRAFTIIELLVTIVIIGVLATIIFVSYTGVQKQAAVNALKYDLKNASTRLEVDVSRNGSYPLSESAANSGKGLPKSAGTVYRYTLTDGEYCLDAMSTKSGNSVFHISSTNGSTEEGACPILTPLTAIAAISGTTQVGSVLTAGALTPSGATVTYQWQSATTSGGTYTNISSATSSTYTLVAGDAGKYLKVVATGTGDYSGTQTSAATTAIIDSYTKLLLHADGTDASTTFIDSALGKTVSVSGNVQIDTAQSKFGGASGLFDGAGDYLTVPDSNDWTLATTDFTIDLWLRYNVAGIGMYWMQGTSIDYTRFWYEPTNGKLYFGELAAGAWAVLYSTPWTPSANTWYHLVVVRSGTTNWYIFINGVSQTLTLEIGSSSRSIPDKTGLLLIGTNDNAGYTDFLNGWIDEFRFSKGIARWTTNFTPPTQPY